MSTSFSLNTTVAVNGAEASSTLLNNLVNLATFQSTNPSLLIGFDGSSNAVDVQYLFNPVGSLIFNNGTNFHGTNKGLTIADNTSTCSYFLGQSASAGLQMAWNYNNNPALAYASFISVGGMPIVLGQAGSSRVLIGGTTDDGIHSAQVSGGLNYDISQTNLTTISWGASSTINASSGTDLQTIALGGSTTFFTQGLAAGVSKLIRIVGSSTTTAGIAFPAAWTFLGTGSPTSILQNKTALLSIVSFTTADSGVIATYSVQP